jgi:hypothetical protein
MRATAIQKKQKNAESHFRAFEEARDAVTKLRALRPLLSSRDAETLGIIMDRDLMRHLDESTREARAGKTEPLG